MSSKWQSTLSLGRDHQFVPFLKEIFFSNPKKRNNNTLCYPIPSLESESQMQCAVDANLTREQFARDLWNITLRTNVLFGHEWRIMTNDLLFEFQNSTVENVRKGYTGNDVGVKIWTFSAALMFSLTVFTTIGMYLHA